MLESRAADSGRSVRRRRECLNCEFRFTTYERVETMTITVVKRSGTRETFSRSKLLTGLVRACEKTGLETSRQLEMLGCQGQRSYTACKNKVHTAHSIDTCESLIGIPEINFVFWGLAEF